MIEKNIQHDLQAFNSFVFLHFSKPLPFRAAEKQNAFLRKCRTNS